MMNRLMHYEQVPLPGSGGGEPYREDDDSFRYGWRYVKHLGPDGEETTIEVPLTEEDLLFPMEDDHAVYTESHTRDFCYSKQTLTAWYKDKPGVVVMGDHRIDWGVEGIRPMGPDLVVLFDSERRGGEATYAIERDGGHPVFVLEITSEGTRKNDLDTKFDLYRRVGVERYIIVDRGWDGMDPAKMMAYARGETDWEELEPDAQGRVEIVPGDVKLGLEGDRVWLYRPGTGDRFLESDELWKEVEAVKRAKEDAEAKAEFEAQARADAEAKTRAAQAIAKDAQAIARDAKAKAERESQALADAEAIARDAKAKAERESQARADAEAKTEREAKARADAEAKTLLAETLLADLKKQLQELQQNRSST